MTAENILFFNFWVFIFGTRVKYGVTNAYTKGKRNWIIYTVLYRKNTPNFTKFILRYQKFARTHSSVCGYTSAMF